MAKNFLFVVILVGLLTCGLSKPSLGQGIILPTSGAINRGMAGATTGAAIDPVGSMYWNPATISGLRDNELGIGLELGAITWTVESTFPGVGSGATKDETGPVAIPSVGWVYQTENPNVKFGLSLAGVAGYSTNIRADATNPILSPPPAGGGVGLGKVQASAEFLQIAPVFSVVLTERLSVAAGPIMMMGRVPLDENAFAAPNANGFYPRGNGTRNHFGLGAQLGFYYVHSDRLSFGANLKSPTWMESFRYTSEDAAGLPRTDEVNINLPMIATMGMGLKYGQYSLLAVDLRYFDYNNTEGFGDPAVINPDFSVEGLGWDSIFSVHVGSQTRFTSNFTGRIGYIYTSELFDDSDTFFNVGSDLSYRHVFSLGGTVDLNELVSCSFAYSYALPYDSTGPFVAPGIGPVPGSSVTNKVDIHLVDFGINFRF